MSPQTASGRALLNAVAPILTQSPGKANDDEWELRTPYQVTVEAIEREAQALVLDALEAAVRDIAATLSPSESVYYGTDAVLEAIQQQRSKP